MKGGEMGKFIIENITKDGIKTSFLTHSRYETPKPGDPVRLGGGKLGMVDPGAGWIEPGKPEVMLCKGIMGAFMGANHISISGGPFEVVKIQDLKPLYQLHPTKFWTWGRSPQGSGGVNIWIERPLFELKGGEDETQEN
jgi:hypothetical protein